MRYLVLFCSILFWMLPSCRRATLEFDEVVIFELAFDSGEQPSTIFVGQEEIIVDTKPRLGGDYNYRVPSFCYLDIQSQKGKIADSIWQTIKAMDITKITKTSEERKQQLRMEDTPSFTCSFLKNNKIVYEVHDDAYRNPFIDLVYLLYDIKKTLPPNMDIVYDFCPIYDSSRSNFIDINMRRGTSFNERSLLVHLLRGSQRVDTLITQGYFAKEFLQDNILGSWQLIDSLKTDGRYWTFYHRDSSAATLDMGVNFFTYTLGDCPRVWGEPFSK